MVRPYGLDKELATQSLREIAGNRRRESVSAQRIDSVHLNQRKHLDFFVKFSKIGKKNGAPARTRQGACDAEPA